MVRCFIAGVQHECSSFSPIPSARRSFATVRWGVDPEPTTMGLGYGESCRAALELGFDLVTGPFSSAQPSLPAPDHVWQEIREEILGSLRAAGGVDVVWLCLHGAQMSDRTDDCEGELLAMARSIVGERAAIGCLLDLHANLSQRMLEAADFVVSCREYPHIDYHERAVEMLPVLAAAARGEVEPTTAAVRFGGPGVYPTPDEPMRSFVRRFTEAQSRPGVLQVSVNHGFEGSDQPDMSAAVVVTTDGDVNLAERIARDVAADFLAVIQSKSWNGPGVVEAIDEALAFDGGPVVLADRADNAGGGAAGDSTFVLAELLRRDAQDVALALLWDPIAVDHCHAAGLGAILPLRIGGKSGPMSGDPIDVRAEVTSLRTDALQALFGKGEPTEQLGRSAAIRIGGVDVVMNSARQQVFSRHVFTEHGIDPLRRHLLVVKSTQHFMNDFGKLAAHVVRCDGPGTMTSDLTSLPYERAPRPLLGLDPAELLELQPMTSVSSASRRALRRANQT
jgi:microcystin degradation protein MlrC